MSGRAGGGFIFDTNTLHKGEVMGTHDRNTIIYEFHGIKKMEDHGNPANAKVPGWLPPCPSEIFAEPRQI